MPAAFRFSFPPPIRMRDPVVKRTPFGEKAYDAAHEFSFMAAGCWGLSAADRSAVILNPEAFEYACLRAASSQDPAVAAIGEWFGNGALTEAGRRMLAGPGRDPLEVEEFEDYLGSVCAASDIKRPELVRAGLALDGRASPLWWYSDRGRMLVYA